MKKSLLALSVLAAFAGAAHAQSSVTVYGLVDASINGESWGQGSQWRLDSGNQSGSRLGFKGTEDLGGGLKAIFDLEMGMNIDTGTSGQGGLAFGRQAWVGLAGDFGQVIAGRMYSPEFYLLDNVDPFDLGIISGGAGTSILLTSNSTGGWRTNNTVSYTTNNLSGFTGMLNYSFGEVAGNTSDSRQVALSGTYGAGPVYVGFAYHVANDVNANANKLALLGATYDLGVAKLAGAYSKTTTDLNTVDQKTWMLGATIPVGQAGNVLVAYTDLNNNLASATAKQFALGYTYNLSKRTNLYTSASWTKNDANNTITVNNATGGNTDRLINVGIRSKF